MYDIDISDSSETAMYYTLKIYNIVLVKPYTYDRN